MERRGGRSICAKDNRPNGRARRAQEEQRRRERRATKSASRVAVASPARRMDSRTTNFSGQCHESGSHSGTPTYVLDMNDCVPHMDQSYVNQMQPTDGGHMPLQQFPVLQPLSAFPYSPTQFYRQPYTPPEQVDASRQQVATQQEGEVVSSDCNAEADVQEVNGSQVHMVQGKKKGMAKRGKAYDAEEDRVLVSAWLNVSLDAATGTNQDKSTFYQRMHKYFLENYDMNSKRSETSIQQRWSTINRCVMKFCGILGKIERLNQSGKNFQDRVNDAIKEYQEKEPWHFHHCWEMLRDEPKWNDKVLETNQSTHGRETEPLSAPDVSSPPVRPEGRDKVKHKRKIADTSSSNVAVDMLQKMHDRGQMMDEIDNKHKEDLINLEKAKFELHQKQWQAKFDMIHESNKLQRELQREMSQAQIKVQMDLMDVERRKCDSQIMFTDVSKLNYPLREWVLRRQTEILARDGIDPDASSELPKND